MNVLLVIPARAGSKGIPGKNLQPIAGKPLISYAVTNAREATRVDRVIVSTEDARIAEVARKYGAETPFERPADLATDEVSLIPVVAHAASAMERLGWRAEIVVSVQPTAPLLKCATIDAGIRMIIDTGCDSVVSVRQIEHNHPYRAQRLESDGRMIPLFPEGERFLQRQDLPDLYAFSGGLYVRRRQLLEDWSGRDFCLGSDRRAVVVDQRESLNVDTPEDLDRFRTMMADADQKN